MVGYDYESRTIKEQVYEVLKGEIISGKLKPGTKLAEQNIANRLGVSRSPVREAIKQLSGDGLVDNPPNRGAFVKKLSKKEQLDIYDIRMMFECYAAERAADNITEKDIRQFRRMRDEILRSVERQDYMACLNIDMRLHSAIVRLGGNELITGTFETFSAMLNNCLLASLSISLEEGGPQNDHLIMIDALTQRDTDSLVSIVKHHINMGKSHVWRDFQSAGA